MAVKTHSEQFKLYFQRLAVIKILSVLAIICIPQNIAGQALIKRPTIGLALSGGGAHGIAHLGVIKVLEESGLRPDYIAGVSMGSIIGGLYSLGYSSDSIHKILKNINWRLLLSNKIPENKVIFNEKNQYDNSIISLPLSKNKVRLPMGLINGQQIENMFSFYTWPAADIYDFSLLPIPFMCLGTDIKTYTKVNLTKGYLADAIRASSSVPSIFTPIKIDTLLLMDGGLISNFPAREAKDMGSDILIGSYVGFKTQNEEELQSLSGIIKQIAFSKSLEDFEAQKKLADVLINPKTGKISITSFDTADSLIQRGYEAALPFKEYFKKLADSLNRFGMQKPLENILDKQSYTFQKIEIKGNKNYSDFQVRGVLDIDSGEKIDKYMLTEKIELLYGKAWFEKVKYRIVPRNDSLILEIDCIEAPPAMLHGSIHYDNSILAGLILGISARNFITKGTVLNLKSYIAQFYRVDFNFTQFLDRNQKFGLSANFYSDNTRMPILQIKGETGDVISRNFSQGLSINRQLGLNQLMSLSVNLENTYLIPYHNPDINIKNLSYNYISGTYNYQINTLNTKYFPDKGMMLNVSLGSTMLHSASVRTDSSKTVFKRDDTAGPSFERFFILKGHIKQYFTSVEKLTYSINGDVLLITKTDSLSAQNNFYLLGGFESVNRRSVSMVGFHPNEIPVKRLAVIMAELDFELFEKFHLNAIAGIAGAQEVNREEGYSFITGYSIGIGYMSIIGPVRIGIMRGNYKHEEYFNKTKGYISIGYSF